MSKTTIFIGGILSVYYIRHNYMFRPVMLAIFRLYMNTYQVVIQTICGLFLEVGGLCRCEISFLSKKGVSFGLLQSTTLLYNHV